MSIYKQISAEAVRGFFGAEGRVSPWMDTPCPQCGVHASFRSESRGAKIRLTGSCGHRFEGPMPPSIRG